MEACTVPRSRAWAPNKGRPHLTECGKHAHYIMLAMLESASNHLAMHIYKNQCIFCDVTTFTIVKLRLHF